MDDPEREMALASTKSKASDADTIKTTSYNIEALGNKICVHISPGKSRPNLNSERIFANDDVIEPGHRDVYTWGRRKARVGSVPTTFHCKRHMICGDLLKLLAWERSARQRE
jgi:hypothetical protein